MSELHNEEGELRDTVADVAATAEPASGPTGDGEPEKPGSLRWLAPPVIGTLVILALMALNLGGPGGRGGVAWEWATHMSYWPAWLIIGWSFVIIAAMWAYGIAPRTRPAHQRVTKAVEAGICGVVILAVMMSIILWRTEFATLHGDGPLLISA